MLHIVTQPHGLALRERALGSRTATANGILTLMQSDQNSRLTNQTALELARRPRIPRDEQVDENRKLLGLLPMHNPLRRLDRDAPAAELLELGEERPEWWLPLWPYLYRFYDAKLQPLYLGITSCHATRLVSHRKRSEWWP